jgi:Domain of unknown function (DUF4062)
MNTPMRKKRVYVSSTYEDLKHHREAVVQALRGVHDVECMEDYPAADERPLAKCLRACLKSRRGLCRMGL